jgi:23S rRNA (pseudouridine1915-N3)-methyltransferase
VALDRTGRQLDSVGFAGTLAAWRDQGVGVAAFAIGGADGHEADVLARADLVLAFGAMTFPHLLARVMLAEQLWRAHAIRTGHPYHH